MKTFKMKMLAIMAIAMMLQGLHACSRSENKTTDTETEWVKFNDPLTGNEVWQLTSHDSISEAFYFYAPSFTADDRYVIFRSKRAGGWDVYRCDLTNGSILQMTNEGVNAACIHPDGEHMVFISGWKYYKMHVHTLKKELVLDFAGKLPAEPDFRPSLTNDGQYTLVYTQKDDTHALFRVNLETGEIIKVYEQNTGRFSHQQINPVDPNLITYCPLPDTQNDMSLPMHERPRTRIIHVNEATNEPYLMAPYGFRATHDSWSPLGDRYFFFEKARPDWVPASIGSIDLYGGTYNRHYTDSVIKLGHGAVSQDGQWFISDSQDPGTNPLLLLNLEDGKVKTLCWPNASIGPPSNVHVHPNFSLSGNYVIYTSDIVKKGTHQVYVIPVKNIKESWQ
jgi:Tol biopolymer transport system component